MLVDLRHREADALARMLEAAREAVRASAARARLRGRRGADLADRADRVRPGAGRARAATPARRSTGTASSCPAAPSTTPPRWRRACPTAMVFSPSIGGISHAPEEDTAEPDLRGGDRGVRRAGEPAPLLSHDPAATATDLAC